MKRTKTDTDWPAQIDVHMWDIAGANVVEVSIKEDGKVVWINLDGKCILRVCRVKNMVVDDRRSDKGIP